MIRRPFLKSAFGLCLVALLTQFPLVSCTKLKVLKANQNSYQVGEKISPEAFVYDSELNRHSIQELCQASKAKVVVLVLYGGGAMGNQERVGGLWCPDSFEDLHILRFINYKYKPGEVSILPVACAPVYSSHLYGQEQGVYMDEPDESPKFKQAVDVFIDSTEAAVAGKYLPVKTYYDVRLRNLFNRRPDLRPGDGYGPVYEWQGRFRASSDSQKYGTPTFWLLDASGTVLAEPFYGNLYHEKPFELNYSVIDVDKAIEALL